MLSTILRWLNCWTEAQYGKTTSSRSMISSSIMRSLWPLHRLEQDWSSIWFWIICWSIIPVYSNYVFFQSSTVGYLTMNKSALPSVPPPIDDNQDNSEGLLGWVAPLKFCLGSVWTVMWRLVSLKRCPSHDIIAVIRPVAIWYVQHLLLTEAAI